MRARRSIGRSSTTPSPAAKASPEPVEPLCCILQKRLYSGRGRLRCGPRVLVGRMLQEISLRQLDAVPVHPLHTVRMEIGDGVDVLSRGSGLAASCSKKPRFAPQTSG